jgi:hypothetical protein
LPRRNARRTKPDLTHDVEHRRLFRKAFHDKIDTMTSWLDSALYINDLSYSCTILGLTRDTLMFLTLLNRTPH